MTEQFDLIILGGGRASALAIAAAKAGLGSCRALVGPAWKGDRQQGQQQSESEADEGEMRLGRLRVGPLARGLS